MAGLQQFYFFPTDFYYPQPPSAAAFKATVLPLQALKDETANPNKATDSTTQVVLPISTPSTKLSLSPSDIKRELSRRSPIISKQKKYSDAK